MAFVYPIWFLSQNQIVFPGRDAAAGAGASNESQEFSPVFMIILDELSTEALVDKDLEIDAHNFPNFARLAVDGFWFRNGTSVAEQTQASITAIMTGKYQPYENFPRHATHPDTGYNSAMDILKVPTFIKLPHQSSGKTLDQRFASVDILPTIAAALDLKSETNFEGIAALEKDALERTSYKFYSKYNQGFIEHDMNILSDTYDFRHKLRVLDETNNFAIRLPGYQRLNGIATANATLSTQKIGHTRLATPELYENVNPRDAFIPVLIEGEVDFLEPRAEAQYLAISINGIIKGVGKFYDGDHGSLRFSIFVQENDFSSEKNEIQVFLVQRPESPDPVLTFLSTRTPK